MQCLPRKTRLPPSCCASGAMCRCPTRGSAPPTSPPSSLIWKLQRRSPRARTAGQAASAPVQGNPEIGKDLFTGVTRFQNGGPPCMACHSVGGIGALGGGQLGPDLTGSVAHFGGAAGLNAFVAGTPTPIMKAVWSRATADHRRKRERGRFPRPGRGEPTPGGSDMATRGSGCAGPCGPAGGRGLEMAEPAAQWGMASDGGRTHHRAWRLSSNHRR